MIKISRKSKGINAERELFHMLWKEGYASCRVAGSGNTKYPSVDVIAGKGNRKLVIECKSTKTKYLYLGREEVNQVIEFSKIFGAEAWLGVKFNNKGWYFFDLSRLELKEGGISFGLDEAGKNAVSFEVFKQNIVITI